MAWQRETAWRRLDEHGEERAIFVCNDLVCAVEGVGAAAINGSGLIFEYRMELGPDWVVRRAGVVARLGPEEFHRVIERRDDGWLIDGVRAAEYAGCTDLDLSFTPSTNTCAIRRLGLEIGQEGESTAVWVAEPKLTLHVLDQRYKRLDTRRYEYRTGDFSAVIEVDDDGIVTSYPGLFESAMQAASVGSSG
jgi:hypothetical protein